MEYLASNHVRLAIVSEIDHDTGIAYTRWADQVSDDGPRIPIPHPYAGPSGEGIFIGLQVGSIVAVDMLSYERYVPVAVLPYTGNYGDISNTDEAIFDNIGFPTIEPGDVILQGIKGSQVALLNDGSVYMTNSFGEGESVGGDADNSFRCAIDVHAPVKYTVSHAGLKAFGIVRRDIRIEDSEEDFSDFLKNIDSEAVLEEVGRNPSKQISYISDAADISNANSSENKLLRNPAFVENRQILLEYGREWEVGTYDEELARLRSDLIPRNDFEHRRERRSNTLSLSLTYPNELIEQVSGTLVDVFGNILDINKNIIRISNSGKDEKELLSDMFEKARHSVAYHMEINTRKGLGYREEKSNTRKPTFLNDPPDPMISANNARDRSRWAIRVDKEGLTTVNIPATSETGNIPLLTRQETSSVLKVDEKGNLEDGKREVYETKELFRNEKNQDIFLDQFGPGGISIDGIEVTNRLKGKLSSWKDEENQTSLPEFVQAGTAFHDITKTAKAILEKDINKKASSIFDDSSAAAGLPAISSRINASIPAAGTSTASRSPNTGLVEGQPNAGGRSMQINLDGSLETSIGANTIDRVAWILDTAGALVARLGRDRQGRSAMVQTDGYVVLEVGGWDFVGEGPNDQVDMRFVGQGDKRKDALPADPTRFRSGKIVIRLRRANPSNTGPDADGDDQLLIIDDTGITIKSVGQLNLVSDGDLTIKSGAQLILDGEVLRVFESNSRYIGKSGRRIG